MKDRVTIAAIVVLSFAAIAALLFALGWFMRGDIIYSGMFEYTNTKSVSTENDLLQGLKK